MAFGKLLHVAVWCFLWMALSAHDSKADPNGCLIIENHLDRLACYDKIHDRTPRIEIHRPLSGSWVVQQETSKMTDQTTVILSLSSDERVDCGWNRGDKIALVIRCMEGKTVLYFNTRCHITSNEYNRYGDIMYRLDNLPAQTISGKSSSDSKALGLWNGATAIPLAKKMFGKSTMIVRMTPYRESAFTATFQISGLEEVIRPLRDSCRW